jgi:heptosyltransferase II
MPAMEERFSRIIILLPTWVGDAVMATPALGAIRRRFAHARIVWMGNAAAREVLAGLDWADEVVDDPSRRRPSASIWQAGRLLRQGRYDLAVLLSNSFRSALVCRLGGAGRRVGYARDVRGWLLSDRLKPARRPDGSFAPTPAIAYYLSLVQAVGCPIDDRTMKLAVQPAFAAQADELLAEAGVTRQTPLVVINPGASFGAGKLWPVERFAAVADALHERWGAAIAINVGPAQRGIAAAMEETMHHRPAISMARARPSLGLLKALTARAALLITGDTGPRHIAAALGTAVVTIFGPTDPAWTVIDYARERIIRVDVPCGPCQKKVCPLTNADYHQCMLRITPEMVLSGAEELLRADPCPGGREVGA